MRNIASKIFARQEQATIINGDEHYATKGMLSKLSGQKTDFTSTERLRLGAVNRRLYVFFCDSEELSKLERAEIRVGDVKYKLLSAERLQACGLFIGTRAILEKRGGADEYS